MQDVGVVARWVPTEGQCIEEVDVRVDVHATIDADVGHEAQPHIHEGAYALVPVVLAVEAQAVEEVATHTEHAVESKLHGVGRAGGENPDESGENEQ